MISGIFQNSAIRSISDGDSLASPELAEGGAYETGFKVAELGQSHPAGCPIMPEFLDDDFASDWSWTCQTLSADKRRVLDRARRDESQEVAKPAGRKDCDAVIDTKARGRYRERTSQPANMMAFGLSMMRPASNAWVTPREKTSN